MYSKLFILLLFLGAASCKDSEKGALPCNEITPGAYFDARIHDTWCLPDESLKITFDRILEDSRCNVIGIDCIWAGRTVIALKIDSETAGLYTDTLATDESWKGSIDAPGYTLSLDEIKPDIRTNIAVDTATYRFKMLLE